MMEGSCAAAAMAMMGTDLSDLTEESDRIDAVAPRGDGCCCCCSCEGRRCRWDCSCRCSAACSLRTDRAAGLMGLLTADVSAALATPGADRHAACCCCCVRLPALLLLAM
jgi:hypothetical protein